MKKISLTFFLLFVCLLMYAQTPVVIELSSGSDNGILMPDTGVSDPDWTYTDPNGAVSTPVTRYAASGWSTASCNGVIGISRWITGGNATTGYHYYVSKDFQIPQGAGNAALNLRSLSFVRNWTYLVRKNTDNTETETQITATSYLSDGAKGWLNSRSPEVVAYTLEPGIYFIRVKAYTNSGAQRQAVDVNANVQYTPQECTMPAAPVVGAVTQPTCATVTGSFAITNYSAVNSYAVTPSAGVVISATGVVTAPAGTYTITASAGGCTSPPSAGTTINAQPATPATPMLSVAAQPTCTVATGSFTITNYNSSNTYSIAPNAGVAQAGSSITAPAGTYTVMATAGGCTSAPSASITINAQPATPATPILSVAAQPTCTVATGKFTITNYNNGNTYSVAPNAGVTQAGSSITAPAGTYTVTASAGGCTSGSSASVTLNAAQGTTAAIIDLRTGIDNATGLQIANNQIDPDWTEYDANGNLIGNKFSRAVLPAANWSFAQIPGSSGNAKWLEMVNNPSTSTTTFFSRKFTVPTTGNLSLQALSSDSNEVHLIQIYEDGSIKETLVAKTMVKSYLSSGNPLYTKPISSGTYQLSVKVLGKSGKINVNARVNYDSCAHPVTPAFALIPEILPGDPAPALPATSLNGISGTWVPAVVSNTVSGIYTFYPAAGCCATSATLNVVVKDWTKAPNSYIFDPADGDHDGIYIPVKKAYAMWRDANPDFGLNSPIATARVEAVVYWEDVSGLIKTASPDSYGLNIIGSGEDARIEVPVDKTKGKGNAIIAFKEGGQVKWSWHIWVTDSVTKNGSVFRQGYESGKDDIPFSQIKNRDGSNFEFQWMNRNLGATNTSFLGNDWNRSSGLMYQWGRKDPIPPLSYKDGTGYEIDGDAAGAAKIFRPSDRDANEPHPFTNPSDPNNPAYGWTLRPFNAAAANDHSEVPLNIKYSVQHPLTLISYDEWESPTSSKNKFATWFSDQEYKVANTAPVGQDPNSVSWDLWSDNRKGVPSNFSTGNLIAANDARSYELKSAYDPCPCQWRIPSHYGSLVVNNNSGPWGRRGSGFNDDALYPLIFSLNTTNNFLPNVKGHVELGFDFTKQSDRNLGMLPIAGAYVFQGPNYPAASDYHNTYPKLNYTNYTSIGSLPTATYGPYKGIRYLGLRAEAYDVPAANKFIFTVNISSQTNGAAPVRCIKDPNSEFIGDFETEYIDATAANNDATYREWAKDPNSYIVMTNTTTTLRINLRKSYAMQRLYLSANHEPPSGIRSAEVYWSTNAGLISNVSITGTSEDASEMVVSLQGGQTGNAVVALHIGSTGTSADPVIWSWHVWAPETDPRVSPVTYTTESTVPASGSNIINPVKNSAVPPLTTAFMDRNMGALLAFPGTATVDALTAQKSIGLQYQWGRKDPLPSFQDQGTIFRGTGSSASPVNSTQYDNDIQSGGYTSKLSVYGAAGTLNILGNTTDKEYERARRALSYSVQHPLTYFYNDVSYTDWISDAPGLESGRWGHAAEKSPYDPCPQGWRIPDMSFAFTGSTNWVAGDGTKGTSPWYSGNVADPLNAARFGVVQYYNPANPAMDTAARGAYKGIFVNNAGWQFKDPGYTIGNYPVTGIRGEASVAVSNNFPRVGVWSASQAEHMYGGAFALSIRYSKMSTGISLAPHLAMSCRCAQIQYDTTGREIGRYEPDAIPVPAGITGKATNVFAKAAIKQMVKEDRLILFPNPVKDMLFIDAKDSKAYYYQIYSMAGQMVKAGQFRNRQTDISILPAGVYLVRINNSENVVKIIKQ